MFLIYNIFGNDRTVEEIVSVLTPGQVDGLLECEPFLEKLESRAGTRGECPRTLPEAQAREVMSVLVAIDRGKQRGVMYSLRRARLAGTMTAYLTANNETASTYLPEGS